MTTIGEVYVVWDYDDKSISEICTDKEYAKSLCGRFERILVVKVSRPPECDCEDPANGYGVAELLRSVRAANKDALALLDALIERANLEVRNDLGIGPSDDCVAVLRWLRKVRIDIAKEL